MLPFLHASPSVGGSAARAAFVFQGWRRNATRRPLPVAEVAELVHCYARLPVRARKRLDIALRRLRDGTEKMEAEDRVIDMSIALEALFMEGESWKQKKFVSRRASWHFADSRAERALTREAIKEFYDYRSAIIHGNAPEELTPEQSLRRKAQLVDVDDVIRSSLKAMISEGMPLSWDESKDPRRIRHHPPRAESDIPSVKSDSLSWSVEEQKEIDRMLEAVWRPTIDNAPHPGPAFGPIQPTAWSGTRPGCSATASSATSTGAAHPDGRCRHTSAVAMPGAPATGHRSSMSSRCRSRPWDWRFARPG